MDVQVNDILVMKKEHLHDKVELKKAHPCGSTQWEILRVGMDIKLKCLGCGHELMLPRSKAEKSIRQILRGGKPI